MAIRYFGAVQAQVDDQERKATLTWAPRKPGKLPQQVRDKCTSWAASVLEADGYQVDRSACDG